MAATVKFWEIRDAPPSSRTVSRLTCRAQGGHGAPSRMAGLHGNYTVCVGGGWVHGVRAKNVTPQTDDTNKRRLFKVISVQSRYLDEMSGAVIFPPRFSEEYEAAIRNVSMEC